MPPHAQGRLARLAQRRSIVTAAEISRAGIHSQTVSRLVEEGRLERLARGLYRWGRSPLGADHALAAAACAAPRGVVCLESALVFHGLSVRVLPAIQVALERGARAPAARPVPLRFFRFGGEAFSHGIETHRVEGLTVRVYSVAKTLADLFKRRGRCGLDVALEALRAAWEDRRVTTMELGAAARVCRVERVVRPYVEALQTRATAGAP